MSARATAQVRRLGLVVAVFVALMAAFAPQAGADVFGTLSLLSASPFQPTEYAHDPAISADGRYLVFDGAIGGVTGVWRRSDQPGAALEQVAGGKAVLPSVSEDGRYVSFTTNEGSRLAEITNGRPLPEPSVRETPNVYVRDMQKEPGQPGAFTLASAVDGSTEALSYSYANPEAEATDYGSVAAGRSAISADGRKVAFVTTAASNLAGPATPPLQVALRDLDTERTQLVSVLSDPATGRPALDPQTGQLQPVPEQQESIDFGAVYSAGRQVPFEPVQAYTNEYEVPQTPGASISADGSTVTWLGQVVSEQAQTLPEESLPAKYAEPLWRRIADGEQSPTLRVTGGSDPANGECASHPEGQLPLTPVAGDPCQGPFDTGLTGGTGVWDGAEAADVPRLSADGYELVFLSTAPLVSTGAFGGQGTVPSDLYTVDMHPGKSRTAALTRLTEVASANIDEIATAGGIADFGISADGGQVAFTTRRTVFPLSAPSYVSTPAATPGLAELFDVDLTDDTLTRVSHGYEGGASEHPHEETTTVDPYSSPTDGALSPSFSATGELLAFSSTASNLVYGDGNTPPVAHNPGVRDGGDAFLVRRAVFTALPTPQSIGPAPPAPALTPRWTIGVTASTLANGNVRLYLALPGEGLVKVHASISLRVRAHAKHGAKRARAKVLSKTVALASRAAGPSASGLLSMVLPLARNYAALAERHGGLDATVSVTFSAAGHPTLHRSLSVTFKRKRRGTTR